MLTPQGLCTEDPPLIKIITTTELEYTFISYPAAVISPYSRYEFRVEARNSIAGINSSFSRAVETPATCEYNCSLIVNMQVINVLEIRITTVM